MAKRRPRVTTIAARVAVRMSRNRNGTRGRRAAMSGAMPWTVALRIAAKRNASLCSSLIFESIARSRVHWSSFFSIRSASYAPTALLTERPIAALTDVRRRMPRWSSVAPATVAPTITPRIVRAPSNAPMTKYRRMIGPTFVISRESRVRRRHAWRAMLPARVPELGLDVGPDAAEGRLEVEVLRARPLREVGAAPAADPQLPEASDESVTHVDLHRGAVRHDEGRGRLGPSREDDHRGGVRAQVLRQRHEGLHLPVH